MVSETKRCTCKYHDGPNPLPVTEFYRKGNAPDGLDYRCKKCSYRLARAWAKANPEKRRETMNRWNGENREHVREGNRDRNARWREKNREKLRASAREYARQRRGADPEKYREANRRHYREHPEKVPEKIRQAARDNAASLDGAHHHREPWTGPQLEIAAREDLTAKQAAAMLGRTISAVRTVRRKLRTEPKFVLLAGLAADVTMHTGRHGGHMNPNEVAALKQSLVKDLGMTAIGQGGSFDVFTPALNQALVQDVIMAVPDASAAALAAPDQPDSDQPDPASDDTAQPSDRY